MIQREGQLNLGQLIDLLKKAESSNRSYEGDLHVFYDFGYLRPRGVHSWRGDYSEFSLGWAIEGDMKLHELIKMLEESVGAIFEGWKGGLYQMHMDTPVWVSEPRDGNYTAVTGVIDTEYSIIITTAYIEY